jgi:hypothetical protein
MLRFNDPVGLGVVAGDADMSDSVLRTEKINGSDPRSSVVGDDIF